MAITETTKQVGVRVRGKNDSLIAKLTREKAEHDAASVALVARIAALRAENTDLAKDIPEPVAMEI